MAVQNAVQRVHLASIPPTTLMTGNADLIWGVKHDDTLAVRARFARTLRGIVWFAGGCAVAAVLYYWFGFWCLVVPVLVGIVTAILRYEN